MLFMLSFQMDFLADWMVFWKLVYLILSRIFSLSFSIAQKFIMQLGRTQLKLTSSFFGNYKIYLHDAFPSRFPFYPSVFHKRIDDTRKLDDFGSVRTRQWNLMTNLILICSRRRTSLGAYVHIAFYYWTGLHNCMRNQSGLWWLY